MGGFHPFWDSVWGILTAMVISGALGSALGLTLAWSMS